jgi:hypothetical protein
MTIMKYQVHYIRQKKNKTTKQVAGDFLQIEDAIWYENEMKLQGHTEVEIIPVL